MTASPEPEWQEADPISAPIVVLTAGGPNPALVVNALTRRFADIHVLIEQPESKALIFARRAKRFGRLSTFGQIATMAAARALRRLSARRIADLVTAAGLSIRLARSVRVENIASINGDDCRRRIAEIAPAAVLLVSTRLMSRSTLSAFPCPVLNLHAGINPAYRGQMGGYWALIEGNRADFGATVHLVDAGTDTGTMLYRSHASPARGDFIATYPLLLTISALDITVKAMEDAAMGRLVPQPAAGRSILRFPPPIWTWLWYGLSRGVW